MLPNHNKFRDNTIEWSLVIGYWLLVTGNRVTIVFKLGDYGARISTIIYLASHY